jgi:lipid-A-disaccharide synthase
MVIVYRVSLVSYLIGRLLIRLDNIGLPNIVAGKMVVPELIQYEATPENIAEELFKILTDRKRRDAMVEALGAATRKLAGHGAAEKAAMAVYRMIMGNAAGVGQGGIPA